MPTPQVAGRYLNLDRCPDRAAWMEAQLARLGLGWVQRHAAIDGAQLAVPDGCALLPGEYACFLSHRQILEAAPPDAFTLVLEDDTELSEQMPQMLAQAVASGLAGVDLAVFECQTHFTLAHLSSLWNSTNKHLVTDSTGIRRIAGVDLLDAGNFYKWGCGAYLVTPWGRPRLLERMAQWLQAGPVRPLDRHLEHAFGGRQLHGVVTVPFLATTGLQWHGQSSIGNGSRVPPDVLMVLRRLFYAGSIREVEPMTRSFAAGPDDPAGQMFGKVLAVLAASQREEVRGMVREGNVV